MAFTATSEIDGQTAFITLAGELDASSALIFRTEVEKAAAASVSRLVLLMSDLEYMASAGLRVLIFAKQKMGAEADIYVVSAQGLILDTLHKTGFDQGVIVVDSYEAVPA